MSNNYSIAAEWWVNTMRELCNSSKSINYFEIQIFERNIDYFQELLSLELKHLLKYHPALHISTCENGKNLLVNLMSQVGIPLSFLPKNVEMVIRMDSIYIYSQFNRISQIA